MSRGAGYGGGVDEAALSAAIAEQADARLLDPMRYDATRLRAWHAALAKRANTPVDVLCIGDSWTAGKGVTAPPTGRWMSQLRDRLRAAFQPAGVVGGDYWPSYVTTSGWVSPITYTGTTVNQTQSGLGRHVKRIASGTATFTFTGTGCDIVYGTGATAGTFTYTVDGGAAQGPIDANSGTANSGQTVQIRGLAAGAHTVVVTVTAAASRYTYLEGFTAYNGDETKGIRLWDSSFTGYRTSDFIDGLGFTYKAWAMVQPDLVSIELGGNDFISGTVSPAQMVTNLTTLLAAVRANCTVPPSVVLWLMPTIAAAGATLAPWSDYLAALEGFAADDGAITLFDAGALLGDLTTADTYGIDFGDDQHVNAAGHQMLADGLFRLLAGPVAD